MAPVDCRPLHRLLGRTWDDPHCDYSRRNIQYANLGSRFDLEGDGAQGGATLEDGFLYPRDRPGCGLLVDERYTAEMAAAGREELGI